MTASRHWVVQSIRISMRAATLGGIALMVATTAQAQQSTAWSPQPFSKPATSAASSNQVAIPHNSLRDAKATGESTVLRWKTVIGDAKPASESKSYSQALANAPAKEMSLVIRQPESMPVSANVATSQPRSGFQLSAPVARPVVETNAVPSGVQLASYASESTDRKSRSGSADNGVWYDRAPKEPQATDRLVIGNPNALKAEGSASSRKPTLERHPPASGIQRARFQELQNNPLNMEQLGLPPAQERVPSNLPEALLPDAKLPESTSPDATPDETKALSEPQSEPPRIQVPPNTPKRSLIEPPIIPSNPFPGTKSVEPSKIQSPSDEVDDSIVDLDMDDRAPAPPRRMTRSAVNCDSLRQMVNESDITQIRVDSSPAFVEGYKNRDRGLTNTKEAFVKSAPTRTWHNIDGTVLTDGKLVDLALGLVVIEKPDGSRASILMRKLSEADQVYIGEKWGIPVTCSVDDGSFPSRNFTDTTVTWKASGACHKPLYFEDVQLERYGHEWGPFAQPVISTAHFFGNVAVLPYKMGIHPMNECQYSLGYYRPGSCAPWTVGPVPISLRGALFQAKAVSLAAWAIP